VRRERWDALTPEQKKTFVPLCSDLVVKLRSESNRLNNLGAKMQEYLDSDVRLGWLLNTQDQPLEIYRLVHLWTEVSNCGKDE